MQKQTDYADAVKTKYPEQIVIAVAKDKTGRANPITLGWTMLASGTPPMMAISVAKTHYSIQTIRFSECFTISFPSADMAAQALLFGSKSGSDTGKFAESECKTEPAKQIDSLLLSDAVANFECTLVSETDAGDHIIFLGKIIAAHKNTEPKKRLYTIGPNHQLGKTT